MVERGKHTQQSKKSHVVVIGGVKHFQAGFFTSYELKPFPVDLDTLSDDSGFMQHLQNSLGHGWDRDKSLLYSVPADPKLPNASELRGHVLDGRHRSWAWQLRYDKGMWTPEPECKPVPVTSMDNIICLRAYYEGLNRSKDARVVNKHIEKSLFGRLEAHPELTSFEKAKVFFRKNGFVDEETINKIYTKFQVKKNPELRKNRPDRPGASSIFKQSFGGKLESQQTLPVVDDALSVRLMCPADHADLVCPKCSSNYVIVIHDDGSTELRKVVSTPAK